MTARCAPAARRPVPLYFCECRYGRLGIEFESLDRDKNSRAAVVQQIRSGGIDPVRIIEVIEPCEDFPRGQVLDVTAELIEAAAKPREIPEFEELRQRLVDLKNDHQRDLLKNGLYGWTS